MKNLFYTLITAGILFTTSCKEDAPTPTKADELNTIISDILSTSKNTFDNASKGSWVPITESEYNSLAFEIINVTVSGISEPSFSLDNVQGFWSGQKNVSAVTGGDVEQIPSGSFLFAFKYIRYGSTTADGARVKLSETSVANGYKNIGNALPTASGSSNSTHYYALKVKDGPTTAVSSYVGFYSNANVIAFSNIMNDVGTHTRVWNVNDQIDENTGDGLNYNASEVLFQSLSMQFDQ